MSERGEKARNNKAAEKRQALIASLWTKEELDALEIWDRKSEKGFTTIPRTMTYIARIMDNWSSGTPPSNTYLTLWCHVFDESFVEIKNKQQLAMESGFSGERAVTTWTNRMRKLEELGFIKSKDGPSGEFSYVFMINPLKVIKKHYDTNHRDALYNSLAARLIDIGGKF